MIFVCRSFCDVLKNRSRFLCMKEGKTTVRCLFRSIEATDRMAKTESRMKEVAREREMMIQRFTQLKKNREMALAALEARVSVKLHTGSTFVK